MTGGRARAGASGRLWPVASSRPADSDPLWHPSWRAVPCSFPVRCACPGPWAGPLPSDLSRGQTRRSPRLRLGPGGQAGPQRGANPALAAPAWKQPEARPAPAPVRGRSSCPVWDARGGGAPWGRPWGLEPEAQGAERGPRFVSGLADGRPSTAPAAGTRRSQLPEPLWGSCGGIGVGWGGVGRLELREAVRRWSRGPLGVRDSGSAVPNSLVVEWLLCCALLGQLSKFQTSAKLSFPPRHLLEQNEMLEMTSWSYHNNHKILGYPGLIPGSVLSKQSLLAALGGSYRVP